MPCLNEADTLATCIDKAQRARCASTASRRGHRRRQRQHRRLAGDRGGGLGARVVAVAERGYGSALMGGIAAARGRYVIMGDADDSYDFLEIPQVRRTPPRRLRPRAGLPAGARRREGAAGRHALPPPRWGNPMFSALVAHLVPGADPRRLLRHARLHQGPLRAPRPALHRDGVRHRDDHQVEPRLGAHRRSPDHAAPGRPQGAPARTCGPSATAGGRCASSCCSARAGCSSCPGFALILLGLLGYAVAMPGVHAFGVDLRRAHAALRQPGDALRLPVDPVRRLHQGVRDQRGPAAARPPLERLDQRGHASSGA